MREEMQATIKPLTVAELRAALAYLPDEAPVSVQSYIPGAGDDSKRGGLLVHAEGLINEVTGVEALLWSAESTPPAAAPNEITQAQTQAMRDALKNMLGAFDNAVRRRRMPGGFEDEAIASARAALEGVPPPTEITQAQAQKLLAVVQRFDAFAKLGGHFSYPLGSLQEIEEALAMKGGE